MRNRDFPQAMKTLFRLPGMLRPAPSHSHRGGKGLRQEQKVLLDGTCAACQGSAVGMCGTRALLWVHQDCFKHPSQACTPAGSIEPVLPLQSAMGPECWQDFLASVSSSVTENQGQGPRGLTESCSHQQPQHDRGRGWRPATGTGSHTVHSPHAFQAIVHAALLSTPVPCPHWITSWSCAEATPVICPPPHQMDPPVLLKALDITAFSSALFGLLWLDTQALAVPRAPNLGLRTQQVLNTAFRMQGRHTHSPARGYSLEEADSSTSEYRARLIWYAEGWIRALGCGWGRRKGGWSQSSPGCRSNQGEGRPGRALSPPYPDQGMIPGDKEVL